jgi:environmental stress-induced protein Ves
MILFTSSRRRGNLSVQTPKLEVIRKSSFTPSPWKNGGGVTHEALRVPANADPYRWRVSVAHIDASGPFSDFAAYNRKMVLLQGAGIELSFADGSRKTLRKAGDLIEFDGALTAYCELLEGPCADLNLMVSKADSAAVRVERFSESLVLDPPRDATMRDATMRDATMRDATMRDATMLVFAIDRGFTLATYMGETVTLELWDLAVLPYGSCHLRRLEPGGAGESTSVFVATLKFVSG